MKTKLVNSYNRFSSCKEKGIFEVKWGDKDNFFYTKIKIFTNLNNAKKFYKSIKEDKAFWDITQYPKIIETVMYNQNK